MSRVGPDPTTEVVIAAHREAWEATGRGICQDCGTAARAERRYTKSESKHPPSLLRLDKKVLLQHIVFYLLKKGKFKGVF